MQYNFDFFLDLIAKKLAGSISPYEERLLREIISKDPDAAAVYAEESDLYHSWGFVVKDKPQRPFKVIVVVENIKHWPRIGIRRAAAVAVLILIISGILFFQGPAKFRAKNNDGVAFSFGNRQDNTNRTLIIPKGKEDSVNLTDGSVVRINSASRMQIKFSKDARKVRFEGEGYFRVAPDHRPFIVTTPYATITVLGTEFNINTYDSGVTRITLVKGKIRFKAMNKEVIVLAGEEVVYQHGKYYQVKPCMCDVTTAWQQGLYSFRNENLKTVALRLERLFDTSIVIDDEQLLHTTFNGMINKSIGLKDNIQNIQAVIKFSYHFSGDTLHITSK